MIDSLKKPKAILFDWDNTLVSTEHVVKHCMEKTFHHFADLNLCINEFMQKPHLSLRNLFPDLFGDDWQQAKKIYHDTFESVHLDMLSLMDGSKELLAQVAHHNIFSSIVSNKTGSFLRKEVDHLGLKHHFEVVVGAEDLSEDKPSPLPVKHALEKSKLASDHHVWFVGDSSVDLHTAINSGCQPVIIGDRVTKAEMEKSPIPVLHVDSCKSLESVLKKVF